MLIIADTHTHSIACNHAYSTIQENIIAAKEAGMKFIALTEHGPKMPDAPHIWHIANLHELPDRYQGVQILRGVEADIMDSEGNLDIEDSLLSSLDWVIASMHPPCFAPCTEPEHTRAWLRVAQNPNVDVIGHCGDSRYQFDYATGIRAFKEYGKIVEINNNSAYVRPGAKENCIAIARLCKEFEVKVVVNSDAHFSGKIGHFDTALEMLAAVDFPERLVVNANEEVFRALAAYKRGAKVEA